MNDRTRWGGSGAGRGREDYGQSQQGGWDQGGWDQAGWDRGSRGGQGQHEQWQRGAGQGESPWGRQGAQQGGWHDDRYPGDWQGGEWRGSRDWGGPSAGHDHDDGFRGGRMDHAMDRGMDMERGRSRDMDRAPGSSWAERAWGGSSLREGDRALRGAGGYGMSARRDDPYRPGSQSFASGYGMEDGANYDEPGGRFRREGRWSGAAGGSAAGYGRGYGPDYGRDEGRGFFERAGDQIAAWFGDDEAEARRERDRRGGEPWRESHRGRGPGDYTRSDERIREDANDRLTDDHHVDARRISVRVEQGEITLSGTVPDRTAKRRAEDLVERISGVRHVQNDLRIEAGLHGGASAYSGQSSGTEWNAGGDRSDTRERGLSGGGRPDASAASPGATSAGGTTTASTGATATNSGGSTASGTAGGTATGATGTSGSGTGSGKAS